MLLMKKEEKNGQMVGQSLSVASVVVGRHERPLCYCCSALGNSPRHHWWSVLAETSERWSCLVAACRRRALLYYTAVVAQWPLFAIIAILHLKLLSFWVFSINTCNGTTHVLSPRSHCSTTFFFFFHLEVALHHTQHVYTVFSSCKIHQLFFVILEKL